MKEASKGGAQLDPVPFFSGSASVTLTSILSHQGRGGSYRPCRLFIPLDDQGILLLALGTRHPC